MSMHCILLKRDDLADLKSKLDKLDICKLETTPVDLNKLNDVVKNEVVKKAECNELGKNFDAIQTTDTSNVV